MSITRAAFLFALLAGFSVCAYQTSIQMSTQLHPSSFPIIDGIGSHVSYAATDTGQVNIIRPVRTISTTDQLQPADCHSFLIVIAPTGGLNFALPQPNLTPESYDNGCEVVFRNVGPGVLTLVSSGGSLLANNPSKSIAPNMSCTIDSDGKQWQPENC